MGAVSVGDELKDPWGWLVAAVAGGVGWAALAATSPVALPVGLAIGAAVLGTKVAVGSRRRAGPKEERTRPDELPVPHPASPAGRLLARAGAATARIEQLSTAPGDPWLRAQVDRIDDESVQALDALRQLGGRITLVEQSIAAGDPRRLQAERTRMVADMRGTTDPRLAEEQRRGIAAMDTQLEVAGRLDTLRQTLLTRMETAVLGLEGLAARMGEVVALGPTSIDHDRAADLIGGLTVELDTLRGGLDEASAISSGDVYPPPAGTADRTAVADRRSRPVERGPCHESSAPTAPRCPKPPPCSTDSGSCSPP